MLAPLPFGTPVKSMYNYKKNLEHSDDISLYCQKHDAKFSLTLICLDSLVFWSHSPVFILEIF